MNERQRRALDRAVEEAQDRHARKWNRLVKQDEAEAIAAGVDPNDPADIAAWLAGDREPRR